MGIYCDYCKDYSIGFCLECGKDFCKIHEIDHSKVCSLINPRAISHFNKQIQEGGESK
jgi:hypothetical protein